MSPEEFKRIALSLEGVAEGSHMGAVDFRVGGRIFATLAHVVKGYGNLMLSPEEQSAFVKESPGVFVPVAGGWGRMGATHIVLAKATEDRKAIRQEDVQGNATSASGPLSRNIGSQLPLPKRPGPGGWLPTVLAVCFP
jgi:hypothetical protein